MAVSGHAADCLALLQKINAVPAHVVGHSSVGVIALQLALDAPQAVRSLTLLEAALLEVPAGTALFEALGPSVQMYESGDKSGAVDNFLATVCGKDYRRVVENQIPWALEQAAQDADAFFTGELPAVGDWTFTREHAERITQPVLSVLGANSDATIGLTTFGEINQRVLEWIPNARPFGLPRAAHLLQLENPRDTAEGLAAFLRDN